MLAMREFFKGIAVLFIALMGLVMVSASSPTTAPTFAVLAGILAVVALIKPQPSIWMGSRPASAALLVLALIVFSVTSKKGENANDAKTPGSKNADPLAELRKDQENRPEIWVTIENFSWTKDGFGAVMMANFTIRNALPWPVKDI
jgi:hypothetical protein